MLGNYYKTWDGKECEFVGALDLYTVGAKERMIGNYMYQCDAADDGIVVVGFENHSGKTYLSDKVRPMGKVACGQRQQWRRRHRRRSVQKCICNIQPRTVAAKKIQSWQI